MAPALVPLMPSMTSRPSSRRRSSTPQVKAPCVPPPWSAKLTARCSATRLLRHLFRLGLGIVLGDGGERRGALLRLLLALPHRGIDAAVGEERHMVAALDDAAVLEHEDLVGAHHGREAM